MAKASSRLFEVNDFEAGYQMRIDVNGYKYLENGVQVG